MAKFFESLKNFLINLILSIPIAFRFIVKSFEKEGDGVGYLFGIAVISVWHSYTNYSVEVANFVELIGGKFQASVVAVSFSTSLLFWIYFFNVIRKALIFENENDMPFLWERYRRPSFRAFIFFGLLWDVAVLALTCAIATMFAFSISKEITIFLLNWNFNFFAFTGLSLKEYSALEGTMEIVIEAIVTIGATYLGFRWAVNADDKREKNSETVLRNNLVVGMLEELHGINVILVSSKEVPESLMEVSVVFGTVAEQIRCFRNYELTSKLVELRTNLVTIRDGIQNKIKTPKRTKTRLSFSLQKNWQKIRLKTSKEILHVKDLLLHEYEGPEQNKLKELWGIEAAEIPK